MLRLILATTIQIKERVLKKLIMAQIARNRPKKIWKTFIYITPGVI